MRRIRSTRSDKFGRGVLVARPGAADGVADVVERARAQQLLDLTVGHEAGEPRLELVGGGPEALHSGPAGQLLQREPGVEQALIHHDRLTQVLPSETEHDVRTLGEGRGEPAAAVLGQLDAEAPHRVDHLGDRR